jgi:hypothetical protein
VIYGGVRLTASHARPATLEDQGEPFGPGEVAPSVAVGAGSVGGTFGRLSAAARVRRLARTSARSSSAWSMLSPRTKKAGTLTKPRPTWITYGAAPEASIVQEVAVHLLEVREYLRCIRQAHTLELALLPLDEHNESVLSAR